MTDEICEHAPGDCAIALSLRYLEVIEKTLNIEFDSQGQPICVLGNISQEIIHALKSEIRQVLSSDLGQSAIEATRSYGEEHIQSIAFGHASDFDVLAKIGFLFSERVVFWDVLSSRVLVREKFDEASVGVIADLACNLLLLKPVVELRGAVILPHPLAWSEAARNVAEELAKLPTCSSAEFGLSMALAAIDEGLTLHPYTLPLSRQMPRSMLPTGLGDGESYPEQSHNFANSIAELVSVSGFEFLRDVKLTDFYNVVGSYQELQHELRKHFSTLNGLSELQARSEAASIFRELRKLGEARAKAISGYGIDGTISTFGWVVSAAALAHSVTGFTAWGILGISAPAMVAIRRWFAKPKNNVIVQAFADLRSVQPFTVEYATEIPLLADHSPIVPDDLIEHLRVIAQEHWTEGVHDYLKELPEDTAARILENLNQEQIDRLVNYRSRQQDYIGDYLAYVWDTNPDAFWRHIGETFKSDDGLLVYDLDDVDEILKSADMPLATWMTLLRFFPAVYSSAIQRGVSPACQINNSSDIDDYELDKIAGVMLFQLSESQTSTAKQGIFRIWLSNLDAEKRETVDIFLGRLFPEGVPIWIGSLPIT